MIVLTTWGLNPKKTLCSKINLVLLEQAVFEYYFLLYKGVAYRYNLGLMI